MHTLLPVSSLAKRGPYLADLSNPPSSPDHSWSMLVSRSAAGQGAEVQTVQGASCSWVIIFQCLPSWLQTDVLITSVPQQEAFWCRMRHGSVSQSGPLQYLVKYMLASEIDCLPEA